MSRRCPECGEMHDTVLENMETGEIEQELEKCIPCLLGFGPQGKLREGMPWPITEQITLEEE